jgi:transcription termination/antitermination protein NusG
MNSLTQLAHCTLPPLALPEVCWYAIQTRSRHEKSVAKQLQMRGVTTFLPLVTEMHRWSDRRKSVELPLFSSYVFVQLVSTNEARARVRYTEGVIRFVGQHAEGTPIPNEEIESIRTVLAQNVPWVCHPFLKIGQRVRIRGGCLDGVEGIFAARNGTRSLVISVEPIQRSLVIRIEDYNIELL